MQGIWSQGGDTTLSSLCSLDSSHRFPSSQNFNWQDIRCRTASPRQLGAWQAQIRRLIATKDTSRNDERSTAGIRPLQIFKEAQDLLPGGVNSPVRAFRSVGGNPIVFDRVKVPRHSRWTLTPAAECQAPSTGSICQPCSRTIVWNQGPRQPPSAAVQRTGHLLSTKAGNSIGCVKPDRLRAWPERHRIEQQCRLICCRGAIWHAVQSIHRLRCRSWDRRPSVVCLPATAFSPVSDCACAFTPSQGPHAYDVDGNRYIDYIGSWGPAIVGASNEEVNEVLKAQIDKGTSYGAPCALEVRRTQREQHFCA